MATRQEVDAGLQKVEGKVDALIKSLSEETQQHIDKAGMKPFLIMMYVAGMQAGVELGFEIGSKDVESDKSEAA